MELRDYIDLSVLLRKKQDTREDRRAFGIAHESMRENPAAQLLAWRQMHLQTLERPLLSERIEGYLYSITLMLLLLAFVLGIVSGVALLSYNGQEPVNLVYFLAMVVFLPLVTIVLSLFSMLGANRTKNMLVHVSPAFWMEKAVSLFSKHVSVDPESIRINPRVANWIVIKRSQMAALLFSIGLLLALLGVVATRDVAFAWSTTLDVTPEAFHRFVTAIALPWKSWFPSAVPTLELVAQSHYFRLGGEVSSEMIDHASALGAWWKFLAMATLFYAIVLRFVLYLLSVWGLKRALKHAAMTIEGVPQLLQDMNTPLITTHEENDEPQRNRDVDLPKHTDVALQREYDMIQGWSIPSDMLSVLAETFGVKAPHIDEAGGNNTLEEDDALIAKSHGRVLLFVKAWEPPTMDFMDYLHALEKRTDQLLVFPAGTPEADFRPSPKSVNVWVRKLAAESETVEVKA